MLGGGGWQFCDSPGPAGRWTPSPIHPERKRKIIYSWGQSHADSKQQHYVITPAGRRRHAASRRVKGSGVQPPPGGGHREKAKEKLQTPSVGTDQAWINLSSFRDLRKAVKIHMDPQKKRRHKETQYQLEDLKGPTGTEM